MRISDWSSDVCSSDLTFQAGETGILHIHATFDDFLDGSETHTISVYAPTGFSILTIDEPGLPSGVTLSDRGAGYAIFNVETLNGVGIVDFDLQVQNVSAVEGVAHFHAYAHADRSEARRVGKECGRTCEDRGLA